MLFVFLDGVGIGPDDAEVNAFVEEAGSRARAHAVVPTLQELLGGSLPTLERPTVSSERAAAFPLDATLDTEGIPQSGTGQAALLTGVDAAALHGRHFGPWVPLKLRPIVEERSVLARALRGGRRVAFANAYPRQWPERRGARRTAGAPLAAYAAGLMTRHQEALGAGDAVSSEIVNDGWQRHLGHAWLPDVTPEAAGANLARIADTADLTFYAHYATDTAGHKRSLAEARAALTRVDRFLSGIIGVLPEDVVLLIASDHGNVEDAGQGHTRNPSLGLVASRGPLPDTSGLSDIREVPDFILRALGIA